MQQGAQRADTTCNKVGNWWPTMLRLFAWGMIHRFSKTFKWRFRLINRAKQKNKKKKTMRRSKPFQDALGITSVSQSKQLICYNIPKRKRENGWVSLDAINREGCFLGIASNWWNWTFLSYRSLLSTQGLAQTPTGEEWFGDPAKIKNRKENLVLNKLSSQDIVWSNLSATAQNDNG